MANPTISVIVPVYNVEEHVAECLESVIAQEFGDFELLCVNDCATDRSRDLVAWYAARDDRIRILDHQVNQGLGLSRNTGVETARGDYLFFLDSDDRLSGPGALRVLLRAALSEGSEMTAGSAASLEPDDTLGDWDRRFERGYPGRVLTVLSGMAAYNALIRRPGANYLPLRSWGWLIDRHFYVDCGLRHPAGVHEDMGHNALLSLRARKVQYCRDIVVDYRQRPGSISKSTWSADTVESYMEVWHHFRDNHARFGVSEMTGNAALHVVRNLFWMLQRNGVTPGDEEHIFDCAAGVLTEVHPGTDPEMIDVVLRVIHDVADSREFRPGLLADLINALPAQTMLDGAAQMIGLRHARSG